MKQLIRAASVCLVALSLFTSFAAMAQTHTPKYVSMAPNTKAYFEYLPEGYNPSGTTTYPLILFMTGIGEFGSGSSTSLPLVLRHGIPQLIQNGLFPQSFTVGTTTHKFIVITPQWLTSPRPTAADMDTVLNYIVKNYKVNTKRIYITGLSYGGGLSFAYPGNANTAYRSRIAAVVPTGSPLPDGGYDTIYARSRRIAAGNIPVWATHNQGDVQDSVARTIAYVDYINQAPAGNPLAKKTIFTGTGTSHDSWTKTYDPNFRENGYNVYEWMLLHQKGSAPPVYGAAPTASAGADKTITLPTSSVTLTGSGTGGSGTTKTYSWTKVSGPTEGTISSSTATSTTVTGLTRGEYVFRLTVSDNVSAEGSDDVKVTVKSATGTKAIQVNVYGGSSGIGSTSPNIWNNWKPAAAVASTVFKYIDGTTSTVTATLSATSSFKDNKDYYTAANVGMAPGGVLRHTSQYSGSRTLTIKGLSSSKKYNLEFYASYFSIATNNNTVFTVNGTPYTIPVNYNKTNKAAFASITPDASGQITVGISNTATYNYLNGFAIEESTGTPPTTKYVKTNVYGSPVPTYSNTEWNNWNVGSTATTNINSVAFKYSDGTTSAITATLSDTKGISDNGTAYGSGMAPAEVLRGSSYSAVLRKLTLKGLSVSKTYSIELYASRATSTAGSTIFTVNGSSVTVSNVNNLTNKATFLNLTPNSLGQIEVSINKTATSSYLNGFMLTETNTATSAITATDTKRTLTEAISPLQNAAGISIAPNPVSSRVLLTIRNTYTGAVQVQVVDATGKSQKNVRLVKSRTVLQHTLALSELPKGVYFITIQMSGTRQTITLSKL